MEDDDPESIPHLFKVLSDQYDLLASQAQVNAVTFRTMESLYSSLEYAFESKEEE